MKKTLRYLLLAVLTTMFGAAQAQDIVIDFNAMSEPTIPGLSYDKNGDDPASTAGNICEENGLPNGWSYNQDGVTIVVSPKEESATYPNRFWRTSNGPQLRCYSGTIEVTYTSSIKQIAFDATSNFNMTANTGVLEGKTWEGSGETTSVVFTVSKNTQINKITITPGVGNAQGGGGEEPPVEESTTTFDFTQNNYGMTATSDGSHYEENPYTFSSDDVTATVSGRYRLWKASNGSQDLRIYASGNGKLEFSVPQGQVISKVVFDGSNIGNLCGPDLKNIADKTWEGALNKVEFTCIGGNPTIKTITVTYGAGSEIPIEVTYTDMTMSEATAKSLEGTAMKNINLKLNNALVVYDFVKGNNEGFFVREGDYAIEFYNTGLGLKAGQTITGSIKCNLSPYNNTPEVVKADDASVTNLVDVTLGTGTVTPLEMTADEAYNGDTHLGDLVIVKDAPVVSRWIEATETQPGHYVYDVQSSTELYDKDGNFTGYGTVRIYDYFFNGSYTFPEIPATYVPTFDIKAIYVANSKTTRRLWVLDMKTPGQEDEATAIQAVTTEQTDGAIYNLQGQRISQPARGLYIQNGRKYIAK